MTKSVTLRPKQVKSFFGRTAQVGLPASDAREYYLGRIARMTTSVDVDVEVGDGAFSRPGDDGAYYIEVPTEIPEQTVSSLGEEVWGLLFQETILLHEAAHVLWSDFEELKHQKQASHAPAHVVQAVYNAAEDVAIESYLVRLYNVLKDFQLLNYNLVERNRQNAQNLSVWDAISNGILARGLAQDDIWSDILSGDISVEEQEWVASLDDRLDEFVAEFVNETDGTERVRIATRFAEELYDEADTNGQSRGQSDDTTKGDDDQSSGGAASQQPDVDQDWEPSQSGEGQKSIEELEEEAEDEYEQEANRQQAEMSEQEDSEDPLRRQLEDLTIESNMGKRIQVAEDWNEHEDCSKDQVNAERKSNTLARIFRSKLQNERKSSRRVGLTEGQIESTEIAQVATGSNKFRSREIEPEDKSYSVQIVLDRSGSMRQPEVWNDELCENENTYERIKGAQNATAQIAFGLHDVGVDVSVMSFYESEATMEIPFGSDPRDHANKLFSRRAAGLTPIHKCVELADNQIEEGEFDEHFMLIICDGSPDKMSSYREAIEETDYPVYGVYINEDESTHGCHDDLFDRIRYATPENVDKKCKELCHGIIG